MRWLIVAGCLVSAGVARADATVSMGSLTADGVRLDDVSCALDGGGLFGGLAVVATLSKQRAAIDACATEPTGFPTTFTFRGGRTSAQVTGGGTAAQRACLERALAKAAATVEGRCTAVLRTGAARAESARTPARRSGPMARTTVAQLRALLGQPASSPIVRAFVAPLAADREVSTFGDSTYFSYKPHGLSILFVADRVKTVFLYTDGADAFEAWPGELPEGLTFRDTRAIVERKLGPPVKSGGDGYINFWCDYARGAGELHVTYASKSTTDPNNRLHHLALVAR